MAVFARLAKQPLATKLLVVTGAALFGCVVLLSAASIWHQQRHLEARLAASGARLGDTIRLGVRYAMMLIDREELFDQVSRYVTPEDFTVELYRKVAELLYEQHAKGELNPAQIMNYFTEEEEHRAVAALFNTRIKELTTAGEQEKAIKETILRVKEYSIETATRNLDPTDIQGLQRLMNAKKAVQDLHKLHISIN